MELSQEPGGLELLLTPVGSVVIHQADLAPPHRGAQILVQAREIPALIALLQEAVDLEPRGSGETTRSTSRPTHVGCTNATWE